MAYVPAFPRAAELAYRRALWSTVATVRTLLDRRLAPILARYGEALALDPGSSRTAALRVQRRRLIATVEAVRGAIDPTLPRETVIAAIAEQTAATAERETRRALVAAGIAPAPQVRTDARFDALASVETLPDGRKKYTSTAGSVYVEPKATAKKRAAEEAVHARFKRNEQLLGWAKENAAKIKGVPSQYLDAVRRQTVKAMDAEQPVEHLAQILEERYGVARSRAKQLATDQIGRLDAQITQAEQEAAGVTTYTWVTRDDDRVREMHAALEGTEQRWDAPPVVNEAGDHHHPGGDHGCRCRARPRRNAKGHFVAGSGGRRRSEMSDREVLASMRAAGTVTPGMSDAAALAAMRAARNR